MTEFNSPLGTTTQQAQPIVSGSGADYGVYTRGEGVTITYGVRRDRKEILPRQQIEPEPRFRLSYNVLTFEEIVTRLAEYEQQHAMSTIKMTRHFFEGEYDGNEEMQNWFDIFFLYLGTEQVTHYACP